MTDASDRFEEILTQSCRIERSAASKEATYLDMEFGTFALVGRQRAVKCLLVPLRVGDDMLAVGPMERKMHRLFLPAGTDIEAKDQVMVDDVIWTAVDPADTQSFRGEDHHVEMLVERKAVQDEY